MKRYIYVFCLALSFIIISCSSSVIVKDESIKEGNLKRKFPQLESPKVELPKSGGNILLQQLIAKKIEDSLFDNAQWGVLIKSLKTGETWYELNSGKLFVPASNEKIITAAAALISLSPDFTFETHLDYTGEIKDSVLNGNLIVSGNGDPTINKYFFNDPKNIFRAWAVLLKQKGIKKINGDVIGSDEAFENYTYGLGWSYDDFCEDYAAEINPLQLDENNVNIYIIPPVDNKGKIKFESDLPEDYLKINNKLALTDTGKTDITCIKLTGINSIVISGYIRIGGRRILKQISVSNPTLYYSTILKNVLKESGIYISGEAKDCNDISNWKSQKQDLKSIDIHYSPPLKEILPVMMKRSQNLYAETLTRVMGWRKTGIGSFKEGKKVVEKVLQSFGIKTGSYSYMDGSGLSRYNLISPQQIVQILEEMKKCACWQDWINAFPVAGTDGTLKNRMKGTSAEGNVRAKTGTMSNIRGLSGYVTTAYGEELVFSFLVNNHLRTAKETEKITDSVLELISDFNRQNR
jgi:serine-type D-Ala-D-Ala carboxypeptidase/endopeptidase (penicillin-binding protein 4)